MKDDPFPKTHHHHHHLPPSTAAASSRSLPRTLIWLIIFISLTYAAYTLRLLSSPPSCPPQHQHQLLPSRASSPQNRSSQPTHLPIPPGSTTSLDHVFFGIAASAKLWDKRREYIKLWYRPGRTRGVVWLDRAVPNPGRPDAGDRLLPPVKISSDTSRFAYTNRQGHRSAVRISRIVSETVRLGLKGVRWIVMGDDDTVFVPDNLVRVLRKFDHRQYYYIGSHSESHLQNIYFSYSMAYGGGGFAISYPLAAALSRMQDRCIQRYPGLYGSDDRMQACMAELGVPLTLHQGFHQYDVYGNLFGLLAAHPVSPLISLHHLDVVEPVFPGEAQVAALRRIMDGPARLDSAALMQQSICYDKEKKWTVSVSWGFAVQVIRGVVSPREMETPARTFLNWYRRADYKAYAFNTRPVARNPCHRPFVYYLKSARVGRGENLTVTDYGPRKVLGGGGSKEKCQSTMADPSDTDRVVVYKRQDPDLWDRSPRRNCCRVLKSAVGEKGTMKVDVGLCKEGEIIEI